MPEILPTTQNTFWAKVDRDGDFTDLHRLEFHLADVGAVFEGLLNIPSVRRAANYAAGADLHPITAARLCVFASLHDIGKANIGFQKKIWPAPDRQRGVSHTADMMQLLNGTDAKRQEQFLGSLTLLDDALNHWDGQSGDIVCALMLAALSHHGQPENLMNGHAPRHNHWETDARLGNPFDKIAEIDSLIRRWFPLAFESVAPFLPERPQLQHFFLGLLQLADWIGSDQRFFEYRAEPDDNYMEYAREQAQETLLRIGLSKTITLPMRPFSFVDMFDISADSAATTIQPNAMQQSLVGMSDEEHLLIVESETGSGKTEAALMYFEKLLRAGLVDSLYFALPTRSAAVQIHRRVNKFAERAGTELQAVLALPGYYRFGEVTGELISRYNVHWEDHVNDGDYWTAERSKQFLASRIAVGTIDQAMLSVLKSRHSHMRAASLSRSLLVVDEVHASDTYMRSIMRALVEDHVSKGGYALLMSATLGESARSEWLNTNLKSLFDAVDVPYPAISSPVRTVNIDSSQLIKRVTMESYRTEDVNDIAEYAIAAARAGAKVLVVRNTVRLAVETTQALEELGAEAFLLQVNGVTTLHHGRFASEDRRLLDDAVELHLGHNREPGGKIIVGTQTLEQSLDIDADLLITDLCPMDVLLQRIGRLHRKLRHDRVPEYSEPRCVVLIPTRDILEFVKGRSTTGLGLNRVYENLLIIEATKRQLGDGVVWEIPTQNRYLVEHATHQDILANITAENDRWLEHTIPIRGQSNADRQTAGSVIVDRNEPFYDAAQYNNSGVLWNTDLNNVATRLGEATIDVTVTPAERGVFSCGPSVDGLRIPHWMIERHDRLPNTEILATVTGRDNGFSFDVADTKFHYGRYGLRKIS